MSQNGDGPAAEPDRDRGEGRLELFARHRSLLFSVAYRMLGSQADAEDMLQETFLRWQQAPEPEIRDPRAFLVTVTTRLCINRLHSARARREQYFGQWLPEPLLTATGAGGPTLSRIDGSLSMALLMLLERLTPADRGHDAQAALKPDQGRQGEWVVLVRSGTPILDCPSWLPRRAARAETDGRVCSAAQATPHPQN